MSVTRRLAKSQTRVADAKEERRYLIRGGKAAQDARRHDARAQRHIVAEALRRGDYETLEVV